jgi:hypothetical protein
MSYRVEWMPTAVLIGVVTLLFVPLLGLLVGLAILMLAAAALVAVATALVAGAVVAPMLIFRSVRRWRRARAVSRQPRHLVYGAETALRRARVG